MIREQLLHQYVKVSNRGRYMYMFLHIMETCTNIIKIIPTYLLQISALGQMFISEAVLTAEKNHTDLIESNYRTIISPYPSYDLYYSYTLKKNLRSI